MCLRIRLIALALLALGGCATDPRAPDPGDALYAAGFTPGRLVYATINCDRFLTHAVMSLGRRAHEFDLSVNLYDDCTRAGGGFTYWEVLVLGTYTTDGSLVSLQPTSGATPPFTATFDGTFMRVSLPARTDSLAATPILLQLGPREAF